MASKKINWSDIFENEQALKNALKLIQELQKELKETAQLAKKDIQIIPPDSDEEVKKLVTQIEKLTAENKELTKTEQQLLKQTEKLNQSYSKEAKDIATLKALNQQRNKQLKQQGREVAGLVDDYERLTKETNKAQREFKNLAVRFGATSKQAQVAKKRFDELDHQLREVNDAAKDGRRDVGRYASAFDGLAQRFPALGQFMDNYNQKLQDLGGSQNVGGIQKLNAGFSAMSSMLVAGGIVAGIAAIGKGIYEVIQYQNELVKLNRELKNFSLGLDDTNTNVIGSAQALATTYDIEVTEALNAAKVLSNEFGISGREAFDLIEKGFAGGANASGDFLDQIKEYSTQFNSVGGDAEEFLTVITQSVNQGIFSDKGIDAIKEAGLRLREMPKATKEALDGIGLQGDEIAKQLESGEKSVLDVIGEVSGKLNELPPQSAKVGTAIADIFGGAGEDAGLAYLQTLDEITGGLDGIIEKQGEFAKQQQELNRVTEEFNQTWNGLFGDISDGASIWTDLKIQFYEFITQAIRGTVNLINEWIDLYNESIGFRIVMQTISAIFSSLWDVFKTPYKLIIDAWKNVATIVQGVFSLDADKIKKGVMNAYTLLPRTVVDLGKKIAGNFTDAYNDEVKDRIDLDGVFVEFNPEKQGEKDGGAYAKGLQEGVKKKIEKDGILPDGEPIIVPLNIVPDLKIDELSLKDDIRDAFKDMEIAAQNQYLSGEISFKEYQDKLTEIQLKALKTRFEHEATSEQERQDLKLQMNQIEIQRERQLQQERIALLKQYGDYFIQQIERIQAKQKQALEEEINDRTTAVETQQRLAELGLDNTLAYEQAALAKAQADKAKLARRDVAIEKAKTYWTAYQANLQNDPKTALQKTLADVGTLEAITGAATLLFEDGGVVPDSQILSGARHSNGGVKIEAEGGEAILSRKHTKNLGYGNFSDLQSILQTDSLPSGFFRQQREKLEGANVGIIGMVDNTQELKEIKQAIKSQPVQRVDVRPMIDGFKMIETIKKGNKTIRNNVRIRN